MTLNDVIAPRPARILIVDDDAANRDVFEVVLVNEGFTVVTAASGEEALAAVAQQPFDLIMLDVILPDMSGHTVAATLRGNPATKDIPIIMITAMTDLATKARALHAGVTDFLSKPMGRAELCERVRQVLLTHARAGGTQVPPSSAA